MATYEGKHELDICGTCKYYLHDSLVTGNNTGWCKRRPRLHQKYDDKTHCTNWCHHFEADDMANSKREYIEKAMNEFSVDMPKRVDNRHEDIVDEKAVPESLDSGSQRYSYSDGEVPPSINSERAHEVEQLLLGLRQLQQSAQTHMSDLALQDNMLAIMEAKGMVKAIAIVLQNVEGRLQQLRAIQ